MSTTCGEDVFRVKLKEKGIDMHWAEILTIVGVNVALFSWIRSDMKMFENRIESKIDSWNTQIQKEMKDFHGRLCAIEEKNKRKD